MSNEWERRKLLGIDANSRATNVSSDHYDQWFAPEYNAVYATIPDRLDPTHANNRALHEFHTYRHLSRYEREYRVHRRLDLHLNWDGVYDEKVDWIVDEGDDEDVDTIYSNQTEHLADTKDFSRRSHSNNHRRTDDQSQLKESSANVYGFAGGFFNNYQAVPLSQGYGTHFANVWVGSPTPQRKTVIVDTGSHYTAFPCFGCKHCGREHHTDPYFRPEKSTTFHKLQCSECEDRVPCESGECRFNQAYTEGSSWDAVQVKDQFYCSGMDVLDSVSPSDRKYAIEFMFGCQYGLTGLFVTQLADGIMGMSAHPATLPKKLYDQQKIEHNMFAMCFRRELGTSKRGVTAGSMTLGGMSSNLDTSPFVFAKNVAKVGWYTVYVKNIYIRSGGGQSAKSVDPVHQTIKVRVNVNVLNSGKGVIVDSGTTDTYLNKKVARDFTKAWKRATGQVYSHAPMSLTPEQLRSLPTILVQCQAYSQDAESYLQDDSFPGYVGTLDPSSPKDLLIAIPATSYMDYSPVSKQYMSRLYFTESVGGVLGSNTMQGHNVVFDWQNGRIGFAESSCAYDKREVPSIAEDSGFATDCDVGEPVLTTACIETVDRRMCELNPTGIAVLGKETWTAVVDSPGNDAGISCVEVSKRSERKSTSFDDIVFTCNGEGLCKEERPCQLTCAQAAIAAEAKRLPSTPDVVESACADARWSACDYGCMQTKLESIVFSDGICHEVARSKRPCHIGACARLDPCRVPFIVHTIFAFRNGSVLEWSREAEDVLATSLENIIKMNSNDPIFMAGDVHVVAALPWYQDSDAEDFGFQTEKNYSNDFNSVKLGAKVVVEISIFNAFAEFGNVTSDEDTIRTHTPLSAMLQNLTRRFRQHQSHASCRQTDLYPLAQAALKAQSILRHESFASMLADEIKAAGQHNDIAAFGPIITSSYEVTNSILTSVWLIRTMIDDEVNYFGPQKPWTIKIFVFVQNVIFLFFLFFSVMVIWSCSLSLYEFCTGRSRQTKHRTRHYVTFLRSNTPYAIVPHTEVSNNPDDVEEKLLRGTSGYKDQSLRDTSYKMTTPKKRFRHVVIGNDG